MGANLIRKATEKPKFIGTLKATGNAFDATDYTMETFLDNIVKAGQRVIALH